MKRRSQEDDWAPTTLLGFFANFGKFPNIVDLNHAQLFNQGHMKSRLEYCLKLLPEKVTDADVSAYLVTLRQLIEGDYIKQVPILSGQSEASSNNLSYIYTLNSNQLQSVPENIVVYGPHRKYQPTHKAPDFQLGLSDYPQEDLPSRKSWRKEHMGNLYLPYGWLVETNKDPINALGLLIHAAVFASEDLNGRLRGERITSSLDLTSFAPGMTRDPVDRARDIADKAVGRFHMEATGQYIGIK